jgi:hypothetical protein
VRQLRLITCKADGQGDGPCFGSAGEWGAVGCPEVRAINQHPEPQSCMERCSNRKHENTTADPSASPQDDNLPEGGEAIFRPESFDSVWPKDGQTSLRMTAYLWCGLQRQDTRTGCINTVGP